MIKLFLYASKDDDLVNLKNTVDRFVEEYNCYIQYFAYPMDILDTLIQEKPEKCAVFFDTEDLPYGLEIAQKVHEIHPRHRFVLLCGEYCNPEQMYHMGVTYFVNKPYGDTGILQSIENSIGIFGGGKSRTIHLKRKTGMDEIRLAEIRYIMSDRRKIIVYTGENPTDYYYKLDEVETMLDDGFIRCHQSYIVNMKHIRIFVEEGLLLTDGTFIPISRKNHVQTRRVYMQYISGEQLGGM